MLASVENLGEMGRFVSALLLCLSALSLGNVKEAKFQIAFVDSQHWPNSKYGTVENARY